MKKPNPSKLIAALFGHVMDGRLFFLLHDRAGRIHEILNYPSSFPVSLYDEIVAARHLGAFFDLSALRQGGVAGTLRLPGKKMSAYNLSFERVYSNFPLHQILTVKLDNGLFLARVVFAKILPGVQLNNGLGFFFSGIQSDRLECFEKPIVELFLSSPERPEALLGQPLSHFLSPTPLEFQKAHLAPFSLSERDRFDVLWQSDFSQEAGKRGEEMSMPSAAFHEPGKGLRMESRMGRPVYFCFPPKINLAKQDFIFSMTVKSLQGLSPYMTVGPTITAEEEPDSEGYMAGSAFAGEHDVLKRKGLVITCKKKPSCGREMETSHFCKIGKSLFLYREEERTVEFFDEDFVTHPEARLTFVVRPLSTCLLKAASLRARPSPPSLLQHSPEQHIASLVRKPGQYCLLSRFHNDALIEPTNYYPDLAGYHPINITSFQSVIQNLDKSRRDLQKRTLVLDALLKNYQPNMEELIGSSDAIVRIKGTARTVASSDATILIEGPTGSGKEVLAQFIHQNSPRKNGPFLKVDCATLPKELIESHLFGHEKGAFTGAIAQNIGMFERADGGTLFLDEVGNLPTDLQAKLLRFFNDFTFTRIGGSKTIQVNVRCLLASNVSLRERVSSKAFREDLYYRINVVTLTLPPLKDRTTDIAELSHYFLLRSNALNNKQVREIEAGALDKLVAYPWPGNVRELKNVIEHAVIFAQGETLTPDLIRFEGDADKPPVKRRPYKPRVRFSLMQTDPSTVAGLLKKHLGHVTAVAAEMGVSRAGLYLYLRKKGIVASNFIKGFQ